jgi:hypothetical protein
MELEELSMLNEYESISDLENNALWIIMDPWYPTPYSDILKLFPKIDEYNQITLDKIIQYIPRLKHVCISCPSFIFTEGGKKFVTPHSSISHLFNLKNNLLNLIDYMKKINLSNIVYCGFHYGKCILDKPDGAMNSSKIYNVWVKKDLCGYLPDLPISKYDEEVRKYCTII